MKTFDLGWFAVLSFRDKIETYTLDDSFADFVDTYTIVLFRHDRALSQSDLRDDILPVPAFVYPEAIAWLNEFVSLKLN